MEKLKEFDQRYENNLIGPKQSVILEILFVGCKIKAILVAFLSVRMSFYKQDYNSLYTFKLQIASARPI